MSGMGLSFSAVYYADGTEAEGASNNGWTQDYVYDAYDPGGQYVLEPWGNVSGGYNAFELVGLGGRHIALYNENNPRGTFYMHPNALGSDSNWTDSHGQTTGEEIYDPWGHKLVSGGYVDRFAGMSHRDQTGFDVTPNRDYSSMVDRWMTPDPAGKRAARLDDPQTWNMYVYARNNPTTLTDPTGLKIDSSECDANKQCAKWKASYLKHKKAREQWNALDKNDKLLVKLKWDPKSSKSVTGDYNWNDAGTLTGVTVTLAAKTGHTDNPMNSSEGYVFGSTIKTDPLRQAYVIAHEFGHVEQAQEPGINVLYNWMSQQGMRLSQAEQEYGPQGYSKLDWTGPLERTLGALDLTLEQGADARGKEVVTEDWSAPQD